MEQIDFKGREIENVEYGENEIVVKLKAVKFEPKDGDFVMCNSGKIIGIYRKKGQGLYVGLIGDKLMIDCSFSCSTRFLTDTERQQLLDALAKEKLTWNAEKKQVEKLRWRAKKGEYYYYIGSDRVCCTSDTRSGIDNLNFNLGNYYKTEELAQAAFDEIKLVYAKNL